MGITLDQVTAAYIVTRDEIRELKKQIEQKEELQEKRANYLLGQLQKDNLQNAKTQHGTVYIALKESVTVGDADAFFDSVLVTPVTDAAVEYLYGKDATVSIQMVKGLQQVVREAMQLQFLNKAANKTAVLEAMGDNRSEVPPPGVNYSAVRVAQIRK